MLARSLVTRSLATRAAAVRCLATATATIAAAAPETAPAGSIAAAAPSGPVASSSSPASPAKQPKASIPTYASARLDLIHGLQGLPGSPPPTSVLVRLLLAARHSPVERSLDEIEDLVRKWRAAGLTVPMVASHHATLLAVEQGNPFRAVGWLGNPVELGLSPSRNDLQTVLDALLFAARNGEFTGKVRGEKHSTFRVALGVLGLYPVFGLGAPGKDAIATVVHTCLAQASPGAINAAWHLLDDIAAKPTKHSIASELARVQFHQGTYTTNYLPNQPNLEAALDAFERAVKLERAGGYRTPGQAFEPMGIHAAVAAVNKLKAEVIASKDMSVRTRSRKAFEQSWKNRGIAFHADTLTKFIQEKQLREEIARQAADREAKKQQPTATKA